MLEQMTDPDYYYHVTLSQQIAQNGFAETLPQVKGLGWDVLFTDKEYLFHVITSLFYSFFGEAGIRAVPLVFAAISSLLLTFQSIKNLGLRIFWVPLLIFLVDPYFLQRIIMVRPQTLAVLLFIVILLSYVNQRKYLLLISSALFALSYHGIQIPGILIGAAFFTAITTNTKYLKLSLFCAMGLIIGSLLHPYFPGNITIIKQIMDIVFDSADRSLEYGRELIPWATPQLLKYSLITGITLILGFVCIGSLGESNKSDQKEDQALLMFLSVSFCLFFAASLLVPRGREYLIPAGVFLLIQLLRHIPISGTVLVALFSIAQFFVVKPDYVRIFTLDENVQKLNAIFSAIDSLPENESAHVFNCNWSHSPYLMYKRPKMSFVDILDPSFLALTNPSLHNAREDLKKNGSPDLYFLMADVFKAQYMFCDDANINTAFDKDPHFERLYPHEPFSQSQATHAIYKLKEPERLKNYVQSFNYSLPLLRSHKKNIQAEFKTTTKSYPTTFLNFRHLLDKSELGQLNEAKNEHIANCIFVEPQDITSHIGSQYIGIGGGPNIRLWLNDKPLFQNSGEPERLLSLDTLIPLPAPLEKGDRLEIMVCPGIKQKFFGVTLSLWSNEDFNNLCNKTQQPPSEEDEIRWPYAGLYHRTCIGPIAGKAQP